MVKVFRGGSGVLTVFIVGFCVIRMIYFGYVLFVIEIGFFFFFFMNKGFISIYYFLFIVGSRFEGNEYLRVLFGDGVMDKMDKRGWGF